MRSAWFIARTDVKYLLGRRETLLWTFVMPIVFFYFIGTITGGSTSPWAWPTARSHRLRAPANGGVLVDEIARRLAQNPTGAGDRRGFECSAAG
jgi:hypothetical protein